MTSRYDNNDGRYYDDQRPQRRQDGRAHDRSSASARQRFAEQQERQAYQDAGSQGGRGRLHHDEMIRDHGQVPRSSRQQHNVADFDRERYASRSQSSVQGLRTQGQQHAQDPRRRQAPAQGGRRQVYLDQTGQIPRYDASSAENSGSWARGQKPQQPRGGRQMPPQQYGNMADRYNRNSGMYQARPDAATNVMNAATGVQQGLLSSPMSFLVRIVLIVVLLLVFGVRMMMSSGPASQLADVNTAIAAQQEQLDTLAADNQQMQESIDARQSTLDAYNAIVKAQQS